MTDAVDTNSLITLDTDDAIAQIESWGNRHRIVFEDGVHFTGTDDLDPMRINLVIEDGMVKRAYTG